MPLRIWLRLAETFVPAFVAVAIVLSWQADRRDRAQLASQLAAAQQTIAQATANQKDRDAQLSQTLAQLAAQKQSAVTPEQILNALPQALGLPAPIELQSPRVDANVGAGFSPSPGTAAGAAHAAPGAKTPAKENSANSTINNPLPRTSSAAAPTAVLPSADLKPLYDFALDCQACKAKLAAAQSDLADENTASFGNADGIVALLGERGRFGLFNRIARAAKWFVIGAAAGAVAAKATR